MKLKSYQSKRRFNATPEPRGKVGRKTGNSYVIQKHAASRLHYDFRLELDGVLLSWAVTRGPSMVPGEKRLAIHVEDHPLEYGDFEGTIPEGQYGGGTVMLWDRGTWRPVGDPRKGLKKGHLDFVLEGKKLKGEWHLVRMRKRPGERQEPWLLIKAQDEFSRRRDEPDILEDEPLSVKTGRDIEEILAGQGRGGKKIWQSRPVTREAGGGGRTVAQAPKARLRAELAARNEASSSRGSIPASDPPEMSSDARAGARKTSSQRIRTKSQTIRKSPPPDFVEPCLASLRPQPPTGAGWIHEVKLDGYRIQARLDRAQVRLLTRKALDWSERFPNVAAAVEKLDAETALLDGEIVVEGERGATDFSALQAALREGESERFRYYVFDLLNLDGLDLRPLPLIERKVKLADLLERSPGTRSALRFSDHFEGEGPFVLQEVCALGLEGVVSKRRDTAYVSGRTDVWIKAKCANRQEFVVVGFVPATASASAVGALVLGCNEAGKLRYAGRVGTGYTRAIARDLWRRLAPLEVKRPPVAVPEDERRRDVHWVAPKLVAEAEFRGWTSEGLLRQASYKGLREDKSPDEVVREDTAISVAPARGAERKTTNRNAVMSARGGDDRPGSSGVDLTHPKRIYWPDVGVTKRQLADFYAEVWDWIAPHIVGRPLSFLRCPDGMTGQCFFQKHVSSGLDARHLRTVIDSKGREVIGIEDVNGLLSLVQAGVLEIHVRGSRLDSLELCDRIVFDLDPGEGASWPEIVRAARDVRDRLAAIRLTSFVKLSGGKGLHVVLPIIGTDWEAVKTFAQAFAQAMEADDPGRYVATMTKALRKGRVFVDYLRNSVEQTSIAAYSTRARAGAPVSVPVTWEELGRVKASNQFNVLNLRRRLAGLRADPWADMDRMRQNLPNFGGRLSG